MGVPSPANHRYRSAVAHLHRALQQLIKQKKTKSKTEKDLLSRLVAASKVSKEDSLDDTGIRDELITLLVAGHETTALGMTWTLYLLASTPSAQTKLFNELEEIFRHVPNFK